jgi:hypothetical protein
VLGPTFAVNMSILTPWALKCRKRQLDADRAKRERARLAKHDHREVGIVGRPPLLNCEEKSFLITRIEQKVGSGENILVSDVRKMVCL